MPGNYIHKVGKTEPEDRFKSEEFGPGLVVEGEDVFGVNDGKRCGLGHGISKLAPKGTLVI